MTRNVYIIFSEELKLRQLLMRNVSARTPSVSSNIKSVKQADTNKYSTGPYQHCEVPLKSSLLS